MASSAVAFVVIFVTFSVSVLCSSESGCIHMSRFDYEYQMIQKMTQMEADKKDTDARLEKFQEIVSTFTSKMETFESTLTSATKNIQIIGSLQEELANLSVSIAPTISFSATATGSSYSSGETILFDVVNTNMGDGYNADTGVFTAPAAGLYLFSLTAAGGYNCHLFPNIMQNSDKITGIFVGGYHGNEYGVSSVTVPVQLAKGDGVRVRLSSYTCRSGSSNLHGSFSHFSGLLIHKQ